MPRPPIARISRLLGWGGLAGLLLLSSIPKASTIVFTWPWVFYAQAILVVPLFMVAAAYWREAATPRILGITAILLAGTIGLSVALSRQPHFSFEAALPLWGGLAWTCWITASFQRRDTTAESFRRFTRLVGGAMLIPLAISATLYTAELVDLMLAAGTWRIEFTYHRNWYPLGHWNYTGGLALLTLPWLLTQAWTERGGWRALWAAGSLVAAAVFISASSRGAVLGAGGGALAAGGLWLSLHRPSRRQLIAAALAALVLGGGLLATNPRLAYLVRHPTSISRPGEGDVQRLGMAQAGWLLGWQRPWVGHGPGMVPFVYPEVRAQVIGGVETSYQLHNGPLHWWVTTGTLGVATLAALLATGARALWRWRTKPAGDHRHFALASGCALISYAGLALTDYQLDVIAILALLGLHAGTVLALTPSPDNHREDAQLGAPPSPWRRRAPALGLVGVGLFTLCVLVPHWQARYLHWTALTDTPAAERVLLAQRMLRAVDAAPWCTHYRNAAGFQLARAAVAVDDDKLRAIARNILSDSLELDPAQEPVHAALGWLWLPDDPTPARAHFESALRLLPDRPTTQLGLALACLAQDDRAGCVQALAMELVVNPYFITSPYLDQAPFNEFKAAAYERWEILADKALAVIRLPDWRRPTFSYARAVVRWWHEGTEPTSAELAGANPGQQTLFAALPAISTLRPSPPQPWLTLQWAIASPSELTDDVITQSLPGISSAALANARSRVAAPGATLATCLREPSRTDAAHTRTSLDREHYSLMHRNLDGPGYADLAPYLDDPFLAVFVAPLFPPRESLPGPLVTALGVMTDSAGPAVSNKAIVHGPSPLCK